MQEEKKRILKMVEDGKLKVEEALFLLEQLDATKASVKKEKVVVGAEAEEKKYQHQQATQQKLHSAKEKILEFVDHAYKKMKDFDLDWNFGQSVEISHIYQQQPLVAIKDIDIDVSNGSVKLVPWSQADIRIECEAKVYRVEAVDEAKSLFLKDVLFAVEGEKLRFGAAQKWMKVQTTVFVPEADFEHIRIRLFNGPIHLEHVVGKSVKAKTANGKIELVQLQAEKVEAETVHGKIQVSNSHIREFEAETINGAIDINGSYHKLDLTSFNGNLQCDLHGEQPAVIMAKATSGAIKMDIPSEWALSAELKSNLGSFIVDIDDIQMLDNKNEVVQKLFAFKSIRPAETYTTILADTKTGSITIKKKQ